MLDRSVQAAHLSVDLVLQVAAEHRDGDETHDHQSHRDQGEDRGDQLGPQ